MYYHINIYELNISSDKRQSCTVEFDSTILLVYGIIMVIKNKRYFIYYGIIMVIKHDFILINL
jgi:hypothetical protein